MVPVAQALYLALGRTHSEVKMQHSWVPGGQSQGCRIMAGSRADQGVLGALTLGRRRHQESCYAQLGLTTFLCGLGIGEEYGILNQN